MSEVLFGKRDETWVDNLESKIKILREEVWTDRRDANSDLLSSWLNNFTEQERPYAMFLLSKFMYFDNDTVRELLKRIYEDLYKRPLVQMIRRDHDNTLDESFIEGKFKEILQKTRFLSIGNPSESSAHLLYYFRQENRLSTKLFINPHQLYEYKNAKDGTIVVNVILNDIDKIVFIDDFCATGKQATDFNEQFVKNIKKSRPNVSISYFSLFAIESGLKKVKDLSYDEVNCIFSLDDSFKCFCDESRFFVSESEKSTIQLKCKLLCEKYGEKLYERHPLGYGDSQLLIGFHHNTPNNTLPIFWSEKDDWNPFFKRYGKTGRI